MNAILSRQFRSVAGVAIRFALAAAMPAGGAGCAQNTESKASQTPDQNQKTAPQSRQYEKNAGPVIQITNSNVPCPTTRPAEATTGAVSKTMAPTLEDSTRTWSTDATYVALQYVTINTGDQTPSQTGAATGTSTATQTPTQTADASPTQTVEPTMAVPVTVGLPGSATSGQATATGREGTSTGQTASPTQTPNYTTATVTGTKDQLATISTFLQGIVDAIKARLAANSTTATTQTSQ